MLQNAGDGLILTSGSFQARSLHREGGQSWTWTCNRILCLPVSTCCGHIRGKVKSQSYDHSLSLKGLPSLQA